MVEAELAPLSPATEASADPSAPESHEAVDEGDRFANSREGEEERRSDRERWKTLATARDAAQIRRLFFTGIISSLMFLIALSVRDFISGTVEDLVPKGGVKNRVLILFVVIIVAIFFIMVIYEAKLDL